MPVARSTIRAVLQCYGMRSIADVAEMLTSELVTNAVRYSDGPAWLRLRNVEGRRLRVSVWDANSTLPPPFSGAQELPDCPADATRGRGPHLVRECADSWGGYALRGAGVLGLHGKTLWFEVAASA